MKYEVYLAQNAEEHLDFFKTSGDKTLLKKIAQFIEEVETHPKTGTGKPEPLKDDLSGYYSRRIDKKNRFIYSIDNNEMIVTVLSLRGHYGKK